MLADLAAVRAAHIILASGSPRRVEMFNDVMGLQARVVPSTFPEDLDKKLYTPAQYVEENAKQKALEVYHRLVSQGEPPPSLVVGADTVVVHDEAILEKPKSEDAAKQMLARLSGGAHEVITGVVLAYAAGDEPHLHGFVETTQVEFGALPPEAIDAYVASGEPMDKAGAYGIQGAAGSFVRGIRGCYHNVVGFPMHRFCVELELDRLRRQA